MDTFVWKNYDPMEKAGVQEPFCLSCSTSPVALVVISIGMASEHQKLLYGWKFSREKIFKDASYRSSS